MAEEKKEGRTVLIAMDGSKHAVFAFEWFLHNLYRGDTDEVVLVYCAEFGTAMPPTAMTAWSPGSLETMARHAEEQVKQVLSAVETLVSKHNVKHTLERIHGVAGEAIIWAAEKHKADVIITGSRGHGTLRRTIMGSVSDYVVHHSHVPVLICKHADDAIL